jgi:DNA modification methylase
MPIKYKKKEICPNSKVEWICGDSIEKLKDAPSADFIFSCPPYGDLECYSEDPLDLSTMEYHTFIAAYKRIILRCVKILKIGAMACFVVGDFRDKKTGFYRGFVADTIKAFQECGMELYNDAILVNAIGSLPIRVSAQFESNKKLGKTHQNILVFKKGK